MKSDLSVRFTGIAGDTVERFHFAAAAQTLGFDFVEHTPKVSNTYSKEKHYEPGEPGDIRYYLDSFKHGLLLEDLVEVWLKPELALEEAKAFPGRILGAKDADLIQEVSLSFNIVYLKSVTAHMRLYSLSRIGLPNIDPENDQEREALNALDGFPSRLEVMRDAKDRKNAVSFSSKHWSPAHVGWLKAFRSNYLELRNLWKEVPSSLKIAREGLPPLVLPRGPKFKEMLERWT